MQFTQHTPRARRALALCLSAACLSASLAGCGTVQSVKHAVIGGGDPNAPHVLAGFIGGAVADEPRAALAARQILALGGNAADAAVAAGMMLAVTLPSRASLGGGGACLVYAPGEAAPNHGVPEAILFPPAAPAMRAGDRPAAIPMLARGLYLLSARYGSRDFGSLIEPAERAARDGVPISTVLAADLSEVAGPLLRDPGAATIFAPRGAPLGEGDTIVQPGLAGTLVQLRAAGVGTLYQGLLAQRLEQASAYAGGPFTVADLRNARATLAASLIRPAGDLQAAFLPLPEDGGLAAAAAFSALQHNASVQQAGEASEAAASRFRTQGAGNAETLLADTAPAPALPPLPASTGFTVLDRKGDAVACTLSMNNLFGTGRVAPGTGILLAASPAAKPTPLYAAALAWRGNQFHAAVTGTGQNAAGLAAGFALAQALSGGTTPAPAPGRANVIACPGGAPDAPGSCSFTADPRGAGLAAAGN